ncbi:hypothetical protein ACFOVU_24500 [Nocardiopsis sediminis]|uniref:Uncharacterized protein n=1 Tax=Nocardiopsis sediminis TaxID=1778267 RepID=A0ABV8FWH1_9ACTN
MTRVWRMEDVIAEDDAADEVSQHGGTAVLAYIRALAEHGVEVREVDHLADTERERDVAFELDIVGGWSLFLEFEAVPMERLRNGDDDVPIEIFVDGDGHLGWNAAVKAGLAKVAARRRDRDPAGPGATAPRSGGTGAAEVWRVPDVIGPLDTSDDMDVNGGETLIAYLAALADHGILVRGVDREIDAEGAGMIAFLLELDGGGALYVHVPGVPLAWLHDRAAFRDEWRAWDDEGNICEVFVQHEGYMSWERAIDAGIATARDLSRGARP